MSFQRVGKNILELLVLKKLLDGDRAKILSGKLKDNASASDYLLKKNLVSEEDLVKASAELLNIPFVRIQGRLLDRIFSKLESGRDRFIRLSRKRG